MTREDFLTEGKALAERAIQRICTKAHEKGAEDLQACILDFDVLIKALSLDKFCLKFELVNKDNSYKVYKMFLHLVKKPKHNSYVLLLEILTPQNKCYPILIRQSPNQEFIRIGDKDGIYAVFLGLLASEQSNLIKRLEALRG